jgi:hypothetical protein
MKSTLFFVAGSLLLSPPLCLAAGSDVSNDIHKDVSTNIPSDATPTAPTQEQQLQQQLDELQRDYDRRMSRIEERLQQTQKATRTKKANTFNPAISLILNGIYASYENNPDEYQLPGYALSDEAGLAPQGFSLDESEVTLGANVDQLFYGQATFSFSDNAGETSVATEEAYFETLDLSGGLTLKAGRFYSAIGYLNEKHKHAWDFIDAPLVYRGLFGDQLKQDGVRLSWILPTDTYYMIGGEVGNGVNFPSAGYHSGVGDWLVFANTGGDIGLSHSWQLGLSHWQAGDVKDRLSQGLNTPSYSGDSRIDAVDVVYKWAPEGNAEQRNLKLQAEFFHRNETGRMTLEETAQSSSYDGSQNGWYAEAVYQFIPRWKTGVRYDYLDSSNSGNNSVVLADADLLANGYTPQRTSVMLAWQPSEFSRIRAQFNRDESTANTDNQFFVQYTMAMGAHGAHAY